MYIRNYRLPETWLHKCLKKFHLRRPFNKQHSKRSQTLLKPALQHLHYIYWWLRRKLSWKKSVLVICKMLGLFLKTLTADDKYSLLNRDNLTELFQMQLSKKNFFCQFLSAFLKCRSSFEQFEKKDDRHRLCLSEITDCERHD